MEGGGVEISDRSVKYLKLERTAAGRRVVAFGEELLPQGAVVSGEIRDRDTVVRVLAKVRRSGRFSFVHASLPEQNGYLFEMQVPTGVGTLAEAVPLAISEHVPLAPAESVFDCEPIRDGGRALAVTVFPERLALAYSRAFTDAGFQPLSFELEPQAALRAVVAPGTPAAILVDFGAERSILSVVQGGVACFAESYDGSEVIDAALRAKGLSEEELSRLKTEEGLAGRPDVAEICAKTVSVLATEIDRLRVYWQTHALQSGKHESIRSILLYGGNASMKGLPEYLSRAIGIPAAVAEVWRALTPGRTELDPASIPAIPRFELPRYATTIGLALRADTLV